MAEPVLALENLTKVFRRRWRNTPDSRLVAVDDLTLSVERGEVFGFLGPNGAGKSTTIRMALGLIHPTAGRVRIGGHDLAGERLAALRKVGAFVEAPAFYPYLSGQENLEIFAGLSGGVAPAQLVSVLELVGLRGRERDKVKVYSHGMRQRLGLAACLLPRPELLVLDEPTDGLDPHGVFEVRHLIRRLAREEGLTIFLSSHLLNEMENVCTRVGILDKGRLILQGPVTELSRQHRRWLIETDKQEALAGWLAAQPGLQTSPPPPGHAGLLVALGERSPESVNAALMAAGFQVKQLAPEPAWLERLFLERTTGLPQRQG